MRATILIVWSGATLQSQSFTKQGFIFKGLFTDVAMTQAYDSQATVTKDMALYAKWEKAPRTAVNFEIIIVLSFLLAAFAVFAFVMIMKERNYEVNK